MSADGAGEPVLLLRDASVSAAGGPRLRRYRVANLWLASELELPELAPFEAEGAPAEPRPETADPALGAADPRPEAGDRPDPPAGTPERVFDGEGWVGGELLRVETRHRDGRYSLRVAGTGLLHVSAREIECVSLEAGARDGPLTATLLGPALVLALALRGVFCLHAAAVARGGRAVAFLGASGHGKSTLAAGLDRSGAWRRIADDVLPVAFSADRPWALPAFPQLKLPARLQTADRDSWAQPLAAAHVLEPVDGGHAGARVGLETFAPSSATVSLCAHTVGSRLFASDLRARHLAHCGHLAASMAVGRLIYPLRPGSIASASELLVASL